MATRSERLTDAFTALLDGDTAGFTALLRPDAQWRGVEGMGFNGETPLWHDRREVVDLLAQHHVAGLRFEPVELIEDRDRIVVRLRGEIYKVFTFDGDEIVLLEDCVDREDALARLR